MLFFFSTIYLKWGVSMIDFTLEEEVLNCYLGNEVKKTIIYNNKKYLVKFPHPVGERYLNNAYSEYVGSNIFKLCHFKVQNTILGLYYFHDKKKIVCACEDFLGDEYILQEFKSLTMSINMDKKIDTELDDIVEILKQLEENFQVNIMNRFFDMFIIDAFIGNTDRHNGNWGFIINKNTKDFDFAPIYDNGSCLNPLLEDKELESLSEDELKNISYNTYSCLKIENKKIHYFELIKSMSNNECNKALIRIFPRINLNMITQFIDNIEGMSEVRKKFYIDVLNYRYKVLESVYHKLKEALS